MVYFAESVLNTPIKDMLYAHSQLFLKDGERDLQGGGGPILASNVGSFPGMTKKPLFETSSSEERSYCSPVIPLLPF